MSVITRLPVGGREGKHFFHFFIYSLVYLLYFEVGNYAASSGREGREAFFFCFFIYSLVYWFFGCISKSVITRLPVGGRDGKHFFFFLLFFGVFVVFRCR